MSKAETRVAEPVRVDGALDHIRHEQTFDIVMKPYGVVGNLHAVDWQLMLSLGGYLANLSSKVCNLAVSAFRVVELLEPDGERSRAGVVLCLTGGGELDDYMGAIRTAAAGLFVRLVVGTKDIKDGVLPLEDHLTPEVVRIVQEFAEQFLIEHGGDPISKPLVAYVGGQASATTLKERFAPKPVDDSPLATIKVTAAFEGADRLLRLCRIVPQGDKGNGVQVRFAVALHLEPIHEALFNNRLYEITLKEVRDAKGKVDWIVADFKEVTVGTGQLDLETSSPATPLAKKLGRRGKRQNGARSPTP